MCCVWGNLRGNPPLRVGAEKTRSAIGRGRPAAPDSGLTRAARPGGSEQIESVDVQLEGQLQKLRRPAAQEHPLQKDLKIIHDGAEFRVDGQGQGDGAPLRIQLQIRALGGIIDPVVDIEALVFFIAYPAAAHVGLVGQDEGGGDGVDREGGSVVVVADGGDHGGGLLRLHSHFVQDAEGHHSAGKGMVVAVDHIADVVHKPGDAGQLGILRTVPQLCQNSGGGLGAAGHMGKAVLREHNRIQNIQIFSY